MFKIKLLILSLVSFIFISCTNIENKNYEMKYSLGYITGEYDGLVLKNYLKNYLKSFNLYDENSLFEIKSSIRHSSEVYITNIDNTSDRRNVQSNLIIEIVDNAKKLVSLGADILVAGSFVFKSEDASNTIKKLNSVIN